MPGEFYVEGKAEKIDLTDIRNLISQIQTDITQVKNDITQLVMARGKQLLPMDFWSEPQEEVQIDGAGVTVALPAVTVDGLPASATILRAIVMFKFRMVENTDTAANGLDGNTVAGTSQVIQVRDDSPGVWNDAITFAGGQFGLEGEKREGGDVCIGDVNISGLGKVDGNDIYEFRWLLGKADSDLLNFNDIQMGIRVWYSV